MTKKLKKKYFYITKGCQISDQVMLLVRKFLRVGRTEIEIAHFIRAEILKRGTDDLAFPILVATGKNGINPHHKPNSTKLKKGDVVFIDFGAKYFGWHSDITRTFIMGNPTKKQKEIYNLVLQTQKLAAGEIKSGRGAKKLYEIACANLKKKNYLEYFNHGLGHGVGRQIHERPFLSRKAKKFERLKVGDVITIEPGIYIKDFGGVRIEDDYLVTKKGSRCLTKCPKNLSFATIRK
ncbi:MAG: M24 family metallopeptidase [bacterium]